MSELDIVSEICVDGLALEPPAESAAAATATAAAAEAAACQLLLMHRTL